MNLKAEQLGIMGGTFNPIHHGHLIVARAAKEALGLDRLLMMPNVQSPLRMDEKRASATDRLEMVRLAVKDEPGLEACDLEVKRQGTSFLVETLGQLQKMNPEAQLTFLMGADSLETFDRWKEVERIVEIAKVVVMPRPGGHASVALTDLEKRAPALQGKIHLLPEGPHIDISATEIRDRIKSGKSVRYLVPEAVEAYLKRSAGCQPAPPK
jgi:nicotinate-nucleotide adenylyltransferase